MAPLVPAVKPQAAFFEQCGPVGVLALQRVIAHAREQGLLVICDNRLTSRSYGRQLLASIPPFRRVGSLQEALDCLPA